MRPLHLAVACLAIVGAPPASGQQAQAEQFLDMCLRPASDMPPHEGMMEYCNDPTPPLLNDTAQEAERIYLWRMIIHHDAATKMADVAIAKAERAELRSLAEEMKQDQAKEIAEFRAWLQQWHSFTAPEPSGTGMGKMMASMMPSLERKSGEAFDLAFIDMMIPHHQAAVDASKAVADRLPHPEAKAAARQVIAAQEAEIAQMRAWRATWGTGAPTGEGQGPGERGTPGPGLLLASLGLAASIVWLGRRR